MTSHCEVLCWFVVVVGGGGFVEGGMGEGGGVGDAGGRAEDQVWLKEILQPEEFDYNAAVKPFEDLPAEEQPRVLRCLAPRAEPRPVSYTHTALPAAAATLVVAMDLKPLGRPSGRGLTMPLTLCVPAACGEGDLVAVVVGAKAARLHVRLGRWVLERRLGGVRAGRSTRVFFAVLQNKILWRREDGSTRQAALPPNPSPEPRRYNYSAVFCGLERMPSAFRGDISNVMINFKHVLFSPWQTQDLPPPAALKPYSYTQEYELSHAALRCPRPLVRRLDLALRSLKNNLHRAKDCVLLYVPYASPAAGQQQQQQQQQASAGSGWGVVLTADNRIVFCYDVIHRHGCESFQPPSLSHADLSAVRVRVVRGVLNVQARTSVSRWRGASFRQYAAPLPCPDGMYLGHLPDHLPRTVRHRHQTFEGRLGPLKVNSEGQLNPKTYIQRGPHRVSENLATYALPALSVRGGEAQYLERRVTPGRATHVTCPPGVRGDWHDLAGRVLARGKEIIRIVSPDSSEGEGVYVCASSHARLGSRVLTATAVYYKAHAGGVADGRRLREEKSHLAVQRAFAAAWLVVVALVFFLAAVLAAVARTRRTGRSRHASVLRCLAVFGRDYVCHRAALVSRDVKGFMYQVHALHQAVLARLTSRQRGVVDPLRHMYKTGRSSVDLEKLFSSGRWEAAMQKPPEAPSTAFHQLPAPASPLLHYPDNYRRVADTLMGQARRRPRRRAASPSAPPTTLSTPYGQ